MDALGHFDFLADVPSGIVEDQDDGLVGAGSDGFGEGIEDGLEQGDIDGTGEPPLYVATRRMDEGVEIEPFVLMAAHRQRSLSGLGPDAPHQRFQTETVFVEGPHLDRPAVRLRARLFHCFVEFFLNTAQSSGPAALSCRGRGCCRL